MVLILRTQIGFVNCNAFVTGIQCTILIHTTKNYCTFECSIAPMHTPNRSNHLVGTKKSLHNFAKQVFDKFNKNKAIEKKNHI